MIRRSSARRASAVAITAGLLAGAVAGPAWGHPEHEDAVVADDGSVADGQHHVKQDEGGEGHLPAKNENVRVIGKLEIKDVVDGQIADVAAHKDTAYLASFREPSCTKGGFYVVDIKDAAKPKELGFVPSAPGTYVGEGLQALSVATPSFTGDLLVHNNETCDAVKSGGKAGITLVDVTNPAAPKILAANVGDTVRPDGSTRPNATNVHSVYAWAHDGRLYAVLVDNEEGADVDIMDITDPRSPKIIAEYDLDAKFGVAQPSLGDGSSFLHDMVVTNIKGKQTMIASYWDGGYVQLDVTDPTKATMINQTDFAAVDPERAKRGEEVLPEGNAHQAEFTADRSAFVATDEDFSPYKLESKTADGREFRAQAAPSSRQIAPGETVTGPTVFLGEACGAVQPAQAGQIGVVERGTCSFQLKADNLVAAGYQTGIVLNSKGGGEALVNMLATTPLRYSFVARSEGLRILNAFDATKPSTEQSAPAVGTAGQAVTFRSFFDGWGYVHLYDRATAKELGTYAIPESQDPAFAQGFGDLSVHEVATDPKSSLAYLSYYAGGFRVVDTAGGKLREVGAFIDQGGSNFWGVEVTRVPKYGQVVLASDRDFGLYVLQYAPAGGQ